MKSNRLNRTHRALGLTALVGAIVSGSLVAPGVANATAPGPTGVIAFRAVTDDGFSQLFTINADGAGQRQITHLHGDALLPHWSPQDNLIAFELDTDSNCANLAIINRNGSGLRVLPHADGDVCEAAPTFSADGHRLYYEGYDGANRDAIFSTNIDGTHRHEITHCQGQGVTDPEVSPDGTMISFTCYSDDGAALFDANTDGSHLRQLTPYSTQVGNKSDWSPDSRHIMFISTNDEGQPDAQVNTWTIRPDGTNLMPVTSYPAGGTLAYGNSYSPDGQWILLRLEQAGSYALYKIHPDGTSLTQLTRFSPFRPRNMAWGSALASRP